MSPDTIFTIVYLLLCACIIYPPNEIYLAGFTVQGMFSNYLGSEHEAFVKYHIRKSCLNLFIYSSLPLGYIILLLVLGYIEEVSILFLGNTLFWEIFAVTGLVLPLLSLYQIKNWTDNNYEKHPIAINLSKFSNNNGELDNVDKISIQTSTIIKIVATENWIMKVTPLTMFVIHQSDASLVVKEANTYPLSPQNMDETQYLNIEVKSGRQGVNPFIIRINAVDFRDLKDRVSRSIEILPSVKFHKSVIEKFVDVFKETVESNPLYDSNEEVDVCIGCLQARPNIKIQKLCGESSSENCSTCYCRPLWCIDCIAKWFASRQDSEKQNKWLSSKCSCPMCRATFCVLDVCKLQSANGNPVEE
ncbi:hypothetical protein NQ317_011017 [Molorchus minor]|uniref:E3 ubiquitin-protein ligase TM129 n=1 Tax=Molorchus minor TaxID=1323400 RepID=A0ABQ9IUN6_9CUCU|nr:hypothetical protein NQ317_011017 [Molorchus minor]